MSATERSSLATTLQRANYRGTVRNSEAESARDLRMLDLFERGLPISVLAQRMGVTSANARERIRRAREAKRGCGA